MAELKELIPYAKKLSVLYIDEDQKFLSEMVGILKKVFLRVDEADNATIGVDYVKLNHYDLVITDTKSLIMSPKQLIENLKFLNPYQNIVVTSKDLSDLEIIELYSLHINLVIKKPFGIKTFLDTILFATSKLFYERNYLKPELEKLNEDLLYERKRVGQFMLKEKIFIDKEKAYEDAINTNKNIYALTNLPNKYALQNALNGLEQSLLYINIDHFDFINTIYGMGKANKLLKECAKRLNIFLANNARLFHITADEFVVLITNPSIGQDLLLAHQIKALFKEVSVDFDEHSHFIVFSIGIDKGKGKILFVNAKAASKEARYFGGDQAILYTPQSDYMREQRDNLHWIGILKKAFKEDRIFTFFQPIINNKNPEIKHYEVLCRLMDENNNLVDANKFIHSAKLVGLITQITKTVIDKTFKVFEHNDYNFSLNISIYDLHENYLVDFLAYKCKRYNVTPNRIYLEIVEDIILSKTTFLDEQVIRLKESGYHVIIDDFGSDKSTYSRMFDLQADFIKIDGSFIKALNKDKSYEIIVQSIVDFANKSGIKTIAEHVENEEVYEMVKKLGIDYTQGYLLGEPSSELK